MTNKQKETVNMRFTVQADEVQTRPSKKGEWKVRRLLLLGADGDLTQQFCELDLPSEHAAIGVGKVINVRVGEIISIFSGRARIRGVIESTK